MEDTYWTTPQGDYASRRRAFLEFAAAAEAGRGRGAVFSQLCRLELGRGPIDEEAIREALAYVNARHDCADFTVAGLLRMLYLHAANPLLPLDLVQATCEAVLGFKYWIDEPGYNDLMCFWTENHQIMFHSDEYLAGQLFAEQVFPNVGRDGRWHMARARERILRWIDMKSRLGFSEWDSNCYYDEDMAPLLNLVDFCEDEEVATRAAMLLDVMFLDMAVDSFRGTYGTSHGRTYPQHVLSGRREATSAVQKIAWGMGGFTNPNAMTAVSLATSPRYRVPEVIERIAQDLPAEMENRERHSFRLEDAARLGLHALDLIEAKIWPFYIYHQAGPQPLIVYLQAQDRVVAVDSAERRVPNLAVLVSARPYSIANPQFQDMPVFGEFRGMDNPELIAGLSPQPQVIFKVSPLSGPHPDQLTAKTGIPVVGLEYGNLTDKKSDFYATLRTMGQILGKSERAEEVVAFFERHLAELSRRTADIPDDKRPACYIGGVASRGAHGFTSTEPGYPPFLYTNAKNVAALPGEKTSAVAQISKEKLLEWDPEILFVDLSTTTAGEQASSLYQLTHDPALSALSAVREGNIWGVLPYGGMVQAPPPADRMEYGLSVARHMVLPVASMVISSVFSSIYAWRTFFLIYSSEDYVEMAKAKGLSSRDIERSYILRPTLPTIITNFALMLITLWTGAIILETVFNWPGLGRLFNQAINIYDTPVIVGNTVIYAYLLAVTVFVLDFVYVLVDPRVKIGGGRETA